MNQKGFTNIVLIILLAVLAGAVGYFAFGLGEPFRAPPKGSSPNCGPEDRYKFDVAINSKNDFVNFIKNNQTNLGTWVKLDNFKDRPDGNVNWDKVLTSINTERIGGKTVYVLNYIPVACSGFTLKMTDDGHVSNYGCCGK